MEGRRGAQRESRVEVCRPTYCILYVHCALLAACPASGPVIAPSVSGAYVLTRGPFPERRPLSRPLRLLVPPDKI